MLSHLHLLLGAAGSPIAFCSFRTILKLHTDRPFPYSTGF